MDEALQIPGMRPIGCSALLIRRLHVGELSGEEASRVRSHLASCEHCRATLAAIEREAADVADVSFDRFAERTLEKAHASKVRRLPLRNVALALAACLVVALAAVPLRHALFPTHRNGMKGGTNVELYVGGIGHPARLAGDREVLAPGERVRVGYETDAPRYLTVVSIDDSGKVTALYPETGNSLTADTSPGLHLLPDSVEFTGGGYERVVTVFTDQPVSVESIVAAARRAFEKAGSVEGMGRLDVAGEQTSKLVKH